MAHIYSRKLTGRTLESDLGFYVFTILYSGGTPDLIVSAVSLLDAVKIFHEFEKTMVPDMPSSVESGALHHVAWFRSLAEMEKSSSDGEIEDREMPLGVWVTDLDEDQLLVRDDEGRVCWKNFSGELTIAG